MHDHQDLGSSQPYVSKEVPRHPETQESPRSITELSDLDAIGRFLDPTGVGWRKAANGHSYFWPSDNHPEAAHVRVLQLSPEEVTMLEGKRDEIAGVLASLPQDQIPVVTCLRTCRDIINRILGNFPSDQAVPFHGFFFDAQK